MGKLLNLPVSLANNLESLILRCMLFISFIYLLIVYLYLIWLKNISQSFFMILPMNSIQQEQAKKDENLFVLELCIVLIQSTNSYWPTTGKNHDMKNFTCAQYRETPKCREQSGRELDGSVRACDVML